MGKKKKDIKAEQYVVGSQLSRMLFLSIQHYFRRYE